MRAAWRTYLLEAQIDDNRQKYGAQSSKFKPNKTIMEKHSKHLKFIR